MATSGVGYLGFQTGAEMQAESLLPLLRTLEEGGLGLPPAPKDFLKPPGAFSRIVAGCLVLYSGLSSNVLSTEDTPQPPHCPTLTPVTLYSAILFSFFQSLSSF